MTFRCKGLLLLLLALASCTDPAYATNLKACAAACSGRMHSYVAGGSCTCLPVSDAGEGRAP